MNDWGPAGDRFDVVLIGPDPHGAGGAMADAITLAGGRIVARHRWDEPVAADAGVLVALDISGLGEGPLDSVGDLAARTDIVVCDLDQLDLVAPALLWSDAHLLCDATPADRIAALALAVAQGSAPEAAVREGEGERLRRFGAEVARIADTLGRLARDQGEVADRRPAYDFGPANDAAAPDPQAVRHIIRARRLRAQFFGEGLFEDPAWDMLLDLFAAELEGGRVSVSSLCIAAHVAPTTALRWITRLLDAGVFARQADPRDRRRAFIGLSAQGSAAMRGYWARSAHA